MFTQLVGRTELTRLSRAAQELDARSDTSDTSDLADPSSLSKPLSASRVALALAAAGDSDDDLPAPGSVAAKGASKQAKAVERVLQEEHDAARKRRDAEGETREERRERTVWSEKEVRVARLETSAWTGESWKGRVALALKGALRCSAVSCRLASARG